MPELPEVETIRCALQPKVVGKLIEKAVIRRGSRLMRDTVSAGTLKKRIEGRRVDAVGRRGKYLLFELSGGECLVIHLGMTGKLYVVGKDEDSPEHTHLRLELGGSSLVLSDPRTFGRVMVAKTGEKEKLPALARLGPEPLGKEFTDEALAAGLKGRKAALKGLLLDQSIVAGVGSIYADEACFLARVSPLRPGGELAGTEIKALRQAIVKVLETGIANQGCTIRDYEWDQGKSGGFARLLKAYGREGQTCKRCGEKIIRKVVAGRGASYCPGCQS